MNMTTLGVALSAVGILIIIWAIWYAWRQSRLTQEIKRNELITLWAHLSRTGFLLTEIRRITRNRKFQDTGSLTHTQSQILPGIHKSLEGEYVRIAELIVMKNPHITLETIDQWEELGKLDTRWRKQQFINLIDKDKKEKRVPEKDPEV